MTTSRREDFTRMYNALPERLRRRIGHVCKYTEWQNVQGLFRVRWCHGCGRYQCVPLDPD